MAPQDLRQHLMLNQSRLCTAEEVAQEIGDNRDGAEDFSSDDTKQAGFIAPVRQDLVKGGKPHRSAVQLWTGQWHVGLRFQPERGD